MKPILDACCGGRMFYFDKEDERVLFQDIRDEEVSLHKGGLFKVHPDVVADFRKMPYEDNTFRMVVFDPPHMVYYSKDGNAPHERRGDLYVEYGELRKDWREYLKQGFAECFRVLKPGGFLIFKWSDTDIKVKNILALTPEKPIFGHKVGKNMGTHWICFMKEELKTLRNDDKKAVKEIALQQLEKEHQLDMSSEIEWLDGLNERFNQPFLPQGLDEAAEIDKEEAKKFLEEFIKSPTKSYFAAAIEYFYNRGKEAGAKWMAEQGVTIEGKVVMDFSDPSDIINRRLVAKLGDALLKVEPGDVIIQIRKG